MDLDTPALVVGLVVSALAFVLLHYATAQQRLPPLVFGLVLMVHPCFTGGSVPTLAIGAGLVASLWLIVRSGR